MWISLACRRNSFLEDSIVIIEVRAVCEVRTITGCSWRTQEKLRKEIGGLEDWRKAYVLPILSMSSSEGLYWELNSCVRAKACVILRYFQLYDNTNSGVLSWGFSQSILLCFMCDWIFFSVIFVLVDIVQNWLSFHKFDCRSRLSILL